MSTSQTNEQALESSIEKRMTGLCLEELKEQKESTFGEPVDLASERAELYRGGNGYFIGSPNDFNARFAIDELRFWNFLETTQKEELAKLQKQSDWKLKILERLDRMIKKYGIIRLLKKGLEVDIADASTKGVGQTYLIQHSAGSGKSNSITWAAFQLIETYPENDMVPGNKGVNNPLFDSVIVVTDRRLLDKQLRENIRDFSEVKNIVAAAHSSKELKENLESGKKINITTIQKFPFIVDGIADLSDKRFAVIIDEAHSSQGGSAADNLNRAMGNNGHEEEDPDPQDRILEAMRSRKMRAKR